MAYISPVSMLAFKRFDIARTALWFTACDKETVPRSLGRLSTVSISVQRLIRFINNVKYLSKTATHYWIQTLPNWYIFSSIYNTYQWTHLLLTKPDEWKQLWIFKCPIFFSSLPVKLAERKQRSSSRTYAYFRLMHVSWLPHQFVFHIMFVLMALLSSPVKN